MNEPASAPNHDRNIQEVLDRLKQVERSLQAINERTENLVRLHAKASGAGSIEELRTLIGNNERRILSIGIVGLLAVILAVFTMYMSINSQSKAISRIEELVEGNGPVRETASLGSSAPLVARFVRKEGIVKELLPGGVRLAWWDASTKGEKKDPVVVPVAETTKIVVGRNAVALSDLRPGMRVRCFWIPNETSKPPFRIEVVKPS